MHHELKRVWCVWKCHAASFTTDCLTAVTLPIGVSETNLFTAMTTLESTLT
jgi:hypothetical protein